MRIIGLIFGQAPMGVLNLKAHTPYEPPYNISSHQPWLLVFDSMTEAVHRRSVQSCLRRVESAYADPTLRSSVYASDNPDTFTQCPLLNLRLHVFISSIQR